jgi:DNA integrity scanning protein DisA with diadenylate cyclase activity
MRVRELFKGIETLESSILKDYSGKPQNAKKILSNINFEGVLDMESLSRMLFEDSPDMQVSPKGYRIMEKLNLTEREVKGLTSSFGNLSGIMDANEEELKKILKGKTESFKKELENVKEQILMGKKI